MNAASIAQMLHEGEQVTHVFGCQAEGLKSALVALTDSRLIFSYGMMGKNESVPYSAITQIDKGLTKVEIKGSGVDVDLKSVARPQELINAINEKRRGPAASASPAAASDDPAAMLAQVASLHQAGVLTDRSSRLRRPISSRGCSRANPPRAWASEACRRVLLRGMSDKCGRSRRRLVLLAQSGTLRPAGRVWRHVGSARVTNQGSSSPVSTARLASTS